MHFNTAEVTSFILIQARIYTSRLKIIFRQNSSALRIGDDFLTTPHPNPFARPWKKIKQHNNWFLDQQNLSRIIKLLRLDVSDAKFIRRLNDRISRYIKQK